VSEWYIKALVHCTPQYLRRNRTGKVIKLQKQLKEEVKNMKTTLLMFMVLAALVILLVRLVKFYNSECTVYIVQAMNILYYSV